MKKLIFIAFVFVFGITNAQIEQGDSMLNVGVGFGISFVSTSGDFTAGVPPIQASYEYAISEKFTVGAFAGFATAEFRSNAFGSEFGYDYTYVLAGALGNWQFVNQEKFNAYLGAKLGYVNVSASEVGTLGIGAEPVASGVVLGGHIGGRYFISDSFGLNLEAGYGISYLTGGVTFKF